MMMSCPSDGGVRDNDPRKEALPLEKTDFAQILEEYHPMIRAAVARNHLACMRYEVDPDDVYQEACLALWTVYNRREVLDSVFHSLAQRAVYRSIRHAVFYASQRRGHRPYNPKRAYVKYWLPDSWTLHLRVNLDVTAVEVEEFLESCPEECKSVACFAQHGYTLPEISQMLGVSRRTIERRLEEIRALYQAYCRDADGEVNEHESERSEQPKQFEQPEQPHGRPGLRSSIPAAHAHARRQNHTRAVSHLPRRQSRR